MSKGNMLVKVRHMKQSLSVVPPATRVRQFSTYAPRRDFHTNNKLQYMTNHKPKSTATIDLK